LEVDDVLDFPETIVTWELEQIDKNKTKLTLVHSGFTGKEPRHKSAKDHDEGWSIHLNELVSYYKKKFYTSKTSYNTFFA